MWAVVFVQVPQRNLEVIMDTQMREVTRTLNSQHLKHWFKLFMTHDS
jgi:hypothetical protein